MFGTPTCRHAGLKRKPAIEFAVVCMVLLAGATCSVKAQEAKVIRNSLGMRLVRIPAGQFKMDTNSGWQGASNAAGESKITVTLSKSFYLGEVEITEEIYARVVSKTWRPPFLPENAQLPVVMLSWDDAVEFCDALSELPEEKSAGRVYRLPTEAEWEYACRAGSEAKYCFGDDDEMLGDYAWYVGNIRDGKVAPNVRTVGSKRPNQWGLYDMHGNASELCQDVFGPLPRKDIIDPVGPWDGLSRVVRGGSWSGRATNCSSSARSEMHGSTNSVGFRVAMGFRRDVKVDASVRKLDLVDIDRSYELDGKPRGALILKRFPLTLVDATREEIAYVKRDVTKFLADGWNPNLPTPGGSTLLIDIVQDSRHARSTNDFLFTNLIDLLHAGADPNFAGIDGRTPMHVAVETGNWNAASALIRYGADPDQPDQNGVSPAQLRKNTPLEQMLRAESLAMHRTYVPPKYLRTPTRILGDRRFQLPAQCSSLCYSSDGSLLIAGCQDGSLRVLDANSGELVQTIDVAGELESQRQVSNLRCLPGNVIVFQGSRGLQFWDLDRSTELARFECDRGSLQLSPDGRFLYAGTFLVEVESTRPLKLGNTVRQMRLSHRRLKSFPYRFFTPDSRYLLLFDRDNSARLAKEGKDLRTLWVWDLKADSLQKVPEFELRSPLTLASLRDYLEVSAASPETPILYFRDSRPHPAMPYPRRTLIDASRWLLEETLSRKLSTSQSDNPVEASLRQSVLSPSGGQVAVTGPSTRITTLRMPGMEQVYALNASGHRSAVVSLSCTADGRWLVSGDQEGLLSLWDLSTGSMRSQHGFDSPTKHCCFAKDQLYVVLQDGSMYKCGLDSLHSPDYRPSPRSEDVAWLAYDAPNDVLVVAGKTLQLREASSFRLLDDVSFGNARYQGFSYGRLPESSGETMMSTILGTQSRGSNTSNFWRIREGKLEVVPSPLGKEMPERFSLAAFSQDGKHIAFRSTLEWRNVIWDVEKSTWNRPSRPIPIRAKAMFSPDGRYLVTSEGNRIRFWNIAEQRVQATLDGDGGTVHDFIYLPSGALVTANNDSTIHLWDLEAVHSR